MTPSHVRAELARVLEHLTNALAREGEAARLAAVEALRAAQRAAMLVEQLPGAAARRR